MLADTNLIWIDLEMTGLNPEDNVIIEIATIVTDSQLNVLGEGPVFAIHQPENELAKMDEWCTNQHGKSGLTERVRHSATSVRDAELQTIAFLQKHVPKGVSPMCGNSIGQDRRFLVRYMPELESYFSYRNIDVTTLKELAKRWKPEALKGFSKKDSHLALDDIRDSIGELRHYRKTFINA